MPEKLEGSSVGGVEMLETKQKNLEKIREDIRELTEQLKGLELEEEKLKEAKVEISKEIMQKKEELKNMIKDLVIKEQETDHGIVLMEEEAERQIDQLPESKSQDEHSKEDQETIKKAFKDLF